ncbi:MAG: hypothetical protein PHX72_03230 [Candidatus Shapirobacteria bacterium]|nr:hypothetical protein [Candidatus Shapirobacteria bacterium]
MTFIFKIRRLLTDSPYLPVAILISAVFLVVNGLSSWLAGIYLFAGLVLGWFLISVYLDLVKSPRLAIIFHLAMFQISFLLFSFWLVISNESSLAAGIVVGVNLFFIKEFLFDYRKRRPVLKKRLFNNISISDHLVLAYLVGFVFLVALLAVLVIL